MGFVLHPPPPQDVPASWMRLGLKSHLFFQAVASGLSLLFPLLTGTRVIPSGLRGPLRVAGLVLGTQLRSCSRIQSCSLRRTQTSLLSCSGDLTGQSGDHQWSALCARCLYIPGYLPLPFTKRQQVQSCQALCPRSHSQWVSLDLKSTQDLKRRACLCVRPRFICRPLEG